MSAISDKLEKANDIQSEMFKSKLWDLKIEVRSPNLKERTRILLEASDDNGKILRDKFSPMVVVATCFDPETGEQAFDESHIDLLNSKNGTEMQRLLNVCMRLGGFEGEDELKND